MSARNVLAIAAHPDDIEFLMAGTLVLLGEAGYGLHYMNLANGCCGSTEVDAATIAGIRQDEARQAAASIGAEFHESICNDLEIFYDQATLARVASVIRLVQPTIVLTHGPSDYMEDHTGIRSASLSCRSTLSTWNRWRGRNGICSAVIKARKNGSMKARDWIPTCKR